MKQKRLKNYLKLSILLFCSFALLWQCQDDFEKNRLDAHENDISGQSTVSFRMLSGKEARTKVEQLNAVARGSLDLDLGIVKRSSTESANNGTVDYNNILEVIDTSGVANYTFKIINHPDDSDSVFHNLVLSDDGTEQKVTLIKYEFENNTNKIENFEGKISAKKYNINEPCDQTDTNANFNTGTISIGSGNEGATQVSIPGNGTTDPVDTIGSSGNGSGGSGYLTVSDQPASFHCSTDGCNFHAYSWDEYSTHTDQDGNIYAFTIVLNFGRMADLNPNPNPCDAGGTIGVVKDENNNQPNCEQQKQRLLNLVNIPTIKNHINGLKNGKFSDASNNYKEDGVRFAKTGINQYAPRYPNERLNSGLDYEPDYKSNEIVSIHIHQQKYWNVEISPNPYFNAPVPSDRDIIELLENVKYIKENSPNLAGEVTQIVMTEAGVFALVIDTQSALDALTALQDDKTRDKFETDFKKKVLRKWNKINQNAGETCNANCLESTADRFKNFVKNNKIAGSNLKAKVLQAVIDENNQITDWTCN